MKKSFKTLNRKNQNIIKGGGGCDPVIVPIDNAKMKTGIYPSKDVTIGGGGSSSSPNSGGDSCGNIIIINL